MFKHIPSGGGSDNEPIFNLPPTIKIVLGTLIALFAFKYVAPESVMLFIKTNLYFAPSWFIQTGATWQWLVSLITYQFFHGDIFHILMNSLFLLAIGAGIEYQLGGKKLILFGLACGVAGAFAELIAFAVGLTDGNPIIGASGAVSGLFGAHPLQMARMRKPWGYKKLAAQYAAMFAAFFMVFGLIGGNVAWIDHIGGLVAGMLLFDQFNKPWKRKPKKPNLHIVN